MYKLKGTTPVVKDITRFKSLIYGDHGVGKSHLVCSIPKIYYMDTENLDNYPHFMKMLLKNNSTYSKVNTLDEMMDEVKALMTTQHDYKTVVIDSLSPIYAMGVNLETERIEKQTRADVAYSADTKKPKKTIMNLASLLNKLDMNVIIISHEKVDFAKNAIFEKTYTIPKEIGYMLGSVIYLEARGDKRIGRIFKNKGDNLKLFEQVDLTNGYESLVLKTGRETFEEKSVPKTLATEEQLLEYGSLIKILNVPMDTIQEWLTKADAFNASEFTEEQMNKILTHLKNKQEKKS
jgi:hypothetical protein